jgi:hypothetical protein
MAFARHQNLLAARGVRHRHPGGTTDPGAERERRRGLNYAARAPL